MTKLHCVPDSSHFIHDLEPYELLNRDRLIADNKQPNYRVFVTERKLVEASLSGLSLEVIIFLILFQLLRPWIRTPTWVT